MICQDVHVHEIERYYAGRAIIIFRSTQTRVIKIFMSFQVSHVSDAHVKEVSEQSELTPCNTVGTRC